MVPRSPSEVPDPRPTRTLPGPVVLLAVALLVAAYLALARGWHGSWTRVGTASLAPGFFGFGALGLWGLERRRGRPLPRPLALILLIMLGAVAGGLASALAPTLGSVRAGILVGLIWGAVIGMGWIRPRPGA